MRREFQTQEDIDLEDLRDRRAIDEEDEDAIEEVRAAARYRRSIDYPEVEENLIQAEVDRDDGWNDWSYFHDETVGRRGSSRGNNIDDEEERAWQQYLQDVSIYTPDDYDPVLQRIVKGRLNVDEIIKRHRRVRRNAPKKDTIEHVTQIMESIEEELDDLKVCAALSYI